MFPEASKGKWGTIDSEWEQWGQDKVDKCPCKGIHLGIILVVEGWDLEGGGVEGVEIVWDWVDCESGEPLRRVEDLDLTGEAETALLRGGVGAEILDPNP